MRLSFVLIGFLGLFSHLSFAQGTLRGTVIDDITGEAVSFADVLIESTGEGTSTDLDGTFSFSLSPGTYEITVSFLGYSDMKIQNVIIKHGEVNALGEVRMKEESEVLEEVVVEAEVIRNNEEGLLTIQRKSANVVDGISARAISRSGDANVAAAIKRVTGVSIEGGKHVYVRGLGDRYTKTLLNGMAIPGLDPDKNSVQMDIFPTNLLNNVLVFKTFTPDLPGDFTGGTVDIETKDFPEKETFVIGVNLGFKPNMHFKNNYLTYDASPMDRFGFGKNSRALPFGYNEWIPSEVDARSNLALGEKLESMTRAFSGEMATRQEANFMDYALSASYGNQVNKENWDLGYTFAVNYRQGTEFYEDAIFNSYQKETDPTAYNLTLMSNDVASYGQQSVLWSALASGALKSGGNKFKFGVFHSQNGVSKAADIRTEIGDDNPATLIKDNLEYQQRSVTNVILGGKHAIDKWTLEWKVSPTLSKIDEPDIRYTAYEYFPEEDRFALSGGVGAEVSRAFRFLEEYNVSTRFDTKYDFEMFGRKANMKMGLSQTYKARDFSILNYNFGFKGSREVSGDPNEFFEPAGIWDLENTLGTVFVQGNYEPANTYDATQSVNAVYVMNEAMVHPKLKAIYGLRVEQAVNRYTGQNQQGTVVLDNDKVLDELNFLPSVGLVYNVMDKMNIRASFSRTVARPSFKEKSVAQIRDRLSGRFFYGNIDVEQTDINNMDLRWEYFYDRGEMIALSGFAKMFKNPIELVSYRVESTPGVYTYFPDIFTPENGGDALVVGAELEARKKLAFISDKLEDFSIGTNLTYVHSQVKMKEAEYTIKQNFAREGEEVSDTRPLLGQSPYIVNVYLNYQGSANDWEANLSYNVQGPRLSVVGFGTVPDVYTVPFHSLNFKATKRFGTEDQWGVSVQARNLLSSERKKVYDSYQAEEKVFELLRPGMSFSLGINYNFK